MFTRILGAGLAVAVIGLSGGCSCYKHHCKPSCPPPAVPAAPCCPPGGAPGAPPPAGAVPAVPPAPVPAQSFSVAPPLLNSTR